MFDEIMICYTKNQDTKDTACLASALSLLLTFSWQVFVCGAWEALGLLNIADQDEHSPKQIPLLG